MDESLVEFRYLKKSFTVKSAAFFKNSQYQERLIAPLNNLIETVKQITPKKEQILSSASNNTKKGCEKLSLVKMESVNLKT